MPHRDDRNEHFPILTDKPVEIHNPKRKARVIAVAYGVAIVMSTLAGGFVATRISDDSTDRLTAEIDQSKRQRDTEAQRFQNALDQYRRDQCTVTAKVPQTPDIVDIRARYRCDPVPPASPTPTPDPDATPPTRPPPAGPPPAGNGPPRSGTRRPQPSPPRPAPNPPPPPSPGPPGDCLPLLGICLI